MMMRRVVGLVLIAGFVLTTQTADANSFLLWTKGNAAPVASIVTISGTLEVGQSLTGAYTYSDAEGDLEGASQYQWYRADDGGGTIAGAIAGATATTYTTQAADVGKFLRFQVIPVAQTGTSPGSAATSAWSGPIIVSDPCLVITEADSGVGSLRQVLAKNPCCTTITFAPGVNTITLAGTQHEIPGTCTNLTIDGGSGVTISGNNASRVMAVASDANVTLDALTITNGNAASENGGGIFNYGTLTITSSTNVSDNTANMGGGIYSNGGALTVSGAVSGNTATGGGGGIYSSVGTLTITGTVSNNTANSRGGGIYSSNSTGTVSGTVSGNSVTGSGGGINHWVGTLTVSGTVSGNAATSSGGGIYNGGGIMTVSGEVSGNTAKSGGGGIASGYGTLTVSGTVSGNTANGSGGGIDYRVSIGGDPLNLGSGHLIQGNHSDNDNSGSEIGGGIYVYNVACPSGVNYGTDNFRGSGTGTIDNCNGSTP